MENKYLTWYSNHIVEIAMIGLFIGGPLGAIGIASHMVFI